VATNRAGRAIEQPSRLEVAPAFRTVADPPGRFERRRSDIHHAEGEPMDTYGSREGNSRGCEGRRETNVGVQERTASVVTGALITILGMRRGGVTGALMTLAGGGLIARGVTGHCPGYSALGMNTAETHGYDAHSYDYGAGRSGRPESAEKGPENDREGAAEGRPFDARGNQG
jgi:hypothetical protein